MHRKFTVASLVLFCLVGCAYSLAESPQQLNSAACDGSPEANRRAVLAFYREGLVNLRIRSAIERYVTADFIEHKHDVPNGTRDATASYLEQLIKSAPRPRWEILRTIAERDMVFLHARFTPAVGASPYAVADVFRMRDCKIAEHWDVVAAPPKEQLNPNPRF